MDLILEAELIAVGTGLIGCVGVGSLLYSQMNSKIDGLNKKIDSVDARKAEADVCSSKHIKLEQESASRDARMDMIIKAVTDLVREVATISTKLDMWMDQYRHEQELKAKESQQFLRSMRGSDGV